MNKLLMLIIMVLLLLVQFVSAGVTDPQPKELELLKGESGRFKFQIQTIANPQDIICSYSIKDESPLIVEFDDDEILVPANSKKYVYGTVTVPEGISQGITFNADNTIVFEENFCVACRNARETAGTSVQINTCDLPITVSVVHERTKQNMYVPPKPEPVSTIPVSLVISVLAAIIIIVLIYEFHIHKKKKKR
ncbi:MAG: hypothetical protein ABIC04_03575 [Nanoarchaeota archaeon]